MKRIITTILILASLTSCDKFKKGQCQLNLYSSEFIGEGGGDTILWTPEASILLRENVGFKAPRTILNSPYRDENNYVKEQDGLVVYRIDSESKAWMTESELEYPNGDVMGFWYSGNFKCITEVRVKCNK